jgi:excisionase family DNA binding protein
MQATDVVDEAPSARQLELFAGALDPSECARTERAVKDDRRPPNTLEAFTAGSAKATKPSGGRHSYADRTAVSKPSTGGSRTLPRLAVSPDEAAEILGVSRDYFDEHVIGELHVIRRGRRILVALTELERWLDRAATRATVGRRS